MGDTQVERDTEFLTPDKVAERKEERRQKFGIDENEDRGNWTGRFDFLLSCLGWAVGLGNVWRFPYLCYRNGGGVFLIPYFLSLVFCGIPLFFMELSLGQFCSNGPLTCWKFAPIFKGIGVAQLILSMFVTIYYTMIIAWAFFYMCASFTSKLPWSECNRDKWWTDKGCYQFWPDVNCTVDDFTPYDNGTCYNNTELKGVWNLTAFQNHTDIKRISPSENYFDGRMLRLSSGIEEIGGVQWDLALCLLAVWTISFICLVKGIKSSGKVVYFTATFPYVVLFILMIRGATLRGSLHGVTYFLKPKMEKLLEPKIWYDACNQIFYSLGAGSGGLMALASYNRFHNNCLRDALLVSIANCATSIFAGFVIFSFLGFMATEMGKPLEEVAKHGTGLAFVVYPDAVTRMPISPLWSIIFFFMLITLGLDSQFVSLEVVTTCLSDQFTWLRKHKTKMTLSLCLLLYILGLPLCTRGGAYILQLMDTYCGGWALFVIGLLECIAVGYVYGSTRFLEDIRTMIGYKPSVWWQFCWLGSTPVLTIFVLLFSWVKYSPAKYNDEKRYPGWADGLGWCMSLASIIWILIVAVIKILRHDGPFLRRLRLLTLPKAEWGPALIKHRQLINYVDGFVVDPWASAAQAHTPVAFENPAVVYSINAATSEVIAAENQNEKNVATQYGTVANGVDGPVPPPTVVLNTMIPEAAHFNVSTI